MWAPAETARTPGHIQRKRRRAGLRSAAPLKNPTLKCPSLSNAVDRSHHATGPVCPCTGSLEPRWPVRDHEHLTQLSLGLNLNGGGVYDDVLAQAGLFSHTFLAASAISRTCLHSSIVRASASMCSARVIRTSSRDSVVISGFLRRSGVWRGTQGTHAGWRGSKMPLIGVAAMHLARVAHPELKSVFG